MRRQSAARKIHLRPENGEPWNADEEEDLCMAFCDKVKADEKKLWSSIGHGNQHHKQRPGVLSAGYQIQRQSGGYERMASWSRNGSRSGPRCDRDDSDR